MNEACSALARTTPAALTPIPALPSSLRHRPRASRSPLPIPSRPPIPAVPPFAAVDPFVAADLVATIPFRSRCRSHRYDPLEESPPISSLRSASGAAADPLQLSPPIAMQVTDVLVPISDIGIIL
uniref:Uncharacterized protein n=1 Tax=Aegilops tauschii subsp. strangulata TaxID=200361 RepID=A0A453T0U2_AEGTS